MSKEDRQTKSRAGLTSCIVSLAIVCVFHLQVAPVLAEASSNGEVTEVQSSAVTLDYEGTLGIWMPLEMAKKAQADVEELQIARQQIRLIDDRLKLKDDRIALLLQASSDSKKITESVTGVLEKAVAAQREAEEDEGGLFAGQPVLWLLGGVVAGVVVMALVVGYK